MKAMKIALSWVLTLCLLITPFSSTVVFAEETTPPTVTLYAADTLDYTVGYGATADGTIDLNAIMQYDANAPHILQYTENGEYPHSSASGIPFHTFNIDLEGKTEGTVTVSYEGATKDGERMAVKVYNPTTAAWDVLGTFTGTGAVSGNVDIATYNDDGVVHAMAILDYVTNGSDTMIWSTDPQHYTKFEDLHEYYYQIYQYAAEQYVAGKAGYIMTTGDLVDDRPSAAVSAGQWKVADQAMSYVEAVGMPNGLVTGNHDVGDYKKPDYSEGNPDVDYSKYLEYFSASRYDDQPWYGGTPNDNISHYDLVTIGNVDFIIMYLGYGMEATAETIEWANDVLSTYRHRTAIITTHEYLDAGAAIRAPKSRAELIFNEIVEPNPNVKLVLCGHDDGSVILEAPTTDGRTVYEVLSDYQFVEAEDSDFYANEHYIGSVPGCCGDGYIRLLTVQGDYISNITYSPVTKKYNPYGDREVFKLDLNCGTPDRSFSSRGFTAAILGEETTADAGVDYVIATTDGIGTTYSLVNFVSVPDYDPIVGTIYIPTEYQAYLDLKAEAEAMNLEAYTDESVANLQAVLATDVSYYPESNVVETYMALINALAELEEPVEVIDPATLQSIMNYDMTVSKWKNADTGSALTAEGSYITATQTEQGGIHMALSEAAVKNNNAWPSAVYNGAAYELKANNGKIYMNLDIEADSAWCIYIEAEQANVSGALRMNFAIDNSFNDIQTDSYHGTYKGVYDVTDAFVANGYDPSATITIKRTLLYIVPGDVTYTHVEYLTDVAATDEVDTSALQDLIAFANTLDESLHTATSWKAMQTELAAANTLLENTEGVHQADINLAALKLKNALDKLKLLTDLVEEAEGSLLPADEGLWVPNSASAMNIYRDDENNTVIQNTDSAWPYADYTLPEAYNTTVTDHMLSVDVTVGTKTNMYLMINGAWVPLPKYISAKNTNGDGDLAAGTYTADIPLSSITELGDTQAVSISKVRVYSIGDAASSAVTIRKLMINDYIAPPPVESVKATLLPKAYEDITLVDGKNDGSVTYENGILSATSNSDNEFRLTYTNDSLFDLDTLNALHFVVKSDVPFKMAFHILSANNANNGAWPSTSSELFSSVFTVTDDRVAAGEYDAYLDLQGACSGITDRSSVFANQVIIVMNGTGTLTIEAMDVEKRDLFEWDDSMTEYGEPATPDNPYFQHAAKEAPEVEYKVDLLAESGCVAHPVITAWTKVGDQATAPLNIHIDLNKTPYLYYSFAQPANSNFTFATYNNNNTTQWLIFRDATGEGAYLNHGASNWDSYTNREQYALTSETGCVDMRQFQKNNSTSATITQLAFYNSLGKGVIISYLFFGSEPIKDKVEGDVTGDGTVNIMDAVQLYYHVNGKTTLSEDALARGDVAAPAGNVNITDAVMVYYFVNGKIASFGGNTTTTTTVNPGGTITTTTNKGGAFQG